MKSLLLAASLLLLMRPAFAEPLNVKPGLWETTTVTSKQGAQQPTNLDTLTPEQREKVEKKLAERVKTETRTVKSCLKQSQIDSGEAFTGNPHGGACSHEWQTQTASEQVAKINCKGANPMLGKVEMRAEDPEHMAGNIEMTYGAFNKLQLLTRSKISSKWLSSDCGKVANVSPASPHDK